MFELPLLNTVILLSSGVTVTYAHHSLIQGNRSGVIYGLIATIVLAIVFTALQGIEYTVSSFTISDSVFGSCFYFGTGFHGLHSYSKWGKNNSAKRYPYFRFYSTKSSLKLPLELGKKSTMLNPWFITGFTDAEGCFSIRVRKTTRTRLGWHVEAVFSIGLHLRDLPLLLKIQSYFGGIGRISKGKKNCMLFVSSIQDLTAIIIPHFIKYELITKKRIDFIFFKSVIDIINAKEHLTMEGLQKIVSFKASINWGLTDVLKVAFPKTIPVLRSLDVNTEIIHPYWMAGFVSGEGCFSITANKSSSKSFIRLIFCISQHNRDEELIKSMVDFFGCGTYCKSSLNRTTISYQCCKIADNCEKIIPFFEKYKIEGIKYKDFEDWCKIAKIIQTKDHLTEEGFNQINQIKSGMNKRR